jgi:hypothetical protein
VTTFREGNLQFDFDQRWTVVKYDGPDPGDYRTKLKDTLEDTKAVDFVALCKPADGAEHLFWIEVKDYRAQPRPDQKRLATIVAQKTRDSVAGVVGFYRTSSAADVWSPFMQALSRKKTVVKVLFWVEERPLAGPAQRRVIRAQVQAREIKRRLKWLTAKVIVTGQGLGGVPDGLTVSHFPAAGQP